MMERATLLTPVIGKQSVLLGTQAAAACRGQVPGHEGHRAAGGRRSSPPTLSAGSLACLKNCVGFTLGPVRPSVDQFHKYLPWFLSDPPNIKCPKG